MEITANKIDLHIHSTASDGSDTITELIKKLQTAGIKTFAITDHDIMDGALEMEALVPSSLQYIRGIEFSCITPFKKCHILGYGFNPMHPQFQRALEFGVQLRQEKLQKRVEFLEKQFGIILTEEESQWLYSQKSPGKPHFGIILCKRGLATDLLSAIKKYINPCKSGNDRIDAAMAIHAIVQSSGVPVWAHPLGGEGERRLTKEEFQIQLEHLISAGIKGLECFYSRYTKEESDFLAEQATKNSLLISGGSDYHGGNKKGIWLGKLDADGNAIDENLLTIRNVLGI